MKQGRVKRINEGQFEESVVAAIGLDQRRPAPELGGSCKGVWLKSIEGWKRVYLGEDKVCRGRGHGGRPDNISNSVRPFLVAACQRFKERLSIRLVAQ